MVPCAYLRAFVPTSSLEDEEVATVDAAPVPTRQIWKQMSGGALGVLVPWEPTPGWRLDSPGGSLVCPSRVRLRSLVGILALREQYPDSIAHDLVSDELAGEVASELEVMRFSGRLRTHVLQSPWQVPLRWFLAFDDGDRRYDADRHRLHYEVPMDIALDRVEHAAEVSEHAGLDEELIDMVTDLGGWLGDFTEAGAMLQLDYGELVTLIPEDELADDHSANEMQLAIKALAANDPIRASTHYFSVNQRWAEVRGLETAS